MITDILVNRTEGNISIHTMTDNDKAVYIATVLEEDLIQPLAKVGAKTGVDVGEIFWQACCQMDGIMFVIVENSSGNAIGYCEISEVSSPEPTLGVSISAPYRGKGYGYLAAKLMIEAGWEIFEHPYFVWELDDDNEASRKLALKLGGTPLPNRCELSDIVKQVLLENDIEVNPEKYPDSVERYKIERP